MKDITDDGIIDIAGMGISEISKLISHRNSLMIKDALTKIYNELYIDERLPHDLLKANRKNHSLIVFRLTVQNINSINTTYGYDAGDYILKEIAKVMKDFPRTSEDWVSRYQGIEFILVMHQITENQAKRICSRIDKKIRGLESVFNNQNIAVNVKIGFAGLQGESTPRELIEMAEKNDYRTNEFPETNTNANKELFRKAQLTPREIEVALLLLQGESNNNIAKTLYVGLSTVKKHTSSIFEKTNVKSRAEFISRARL